VDRNFLKDAFNLISLGDLNLSKARLAQCKALMYRQSGPSEEELLNEQFLSLNNDTSDLYGLIHARYIRSPEGKQQPCMGN
jgi:casein kinase II subunit beta